MRSSATARAISLVGGIAIGPMVLSRPSWPRLPARWAMAYRPLWPPLLRFPERISVVIAGDGDFMMNGQELATAVQYDANLLVLVIDNGSFGTIRLHQEREYPSRLSATSLQNPGFCYARKSLWRMERNR